MEIIGVGETRRLHVQWEDAAGNPVQSEESTTWTSDNPDAVAVLVDPNDSTYAMARAAGVVGTAVIEAECEGVVTEFTFTTRAGAIHKGTITVVGTPRPRR